MKLATDAHATWTDTHRQAFALAHDALGDGVDGFVYAETDEMKRAAISLRMIFFKGDVVIGVDDMPRHRDVIRLKPPAGRGQGQSRRAHFASSLPVPDST